MNPVEIITTKRDLNELSDDQIEFMINGFTTGDIPDYQMAAFAMAVFFANMSTRETNTLTQVMMDTGQVMRWSPSERPKVDKHSTGGIGDKISIPLAPLLASVGLDVPMISGRGLGATGGTLDKLESIPGFRTNLTIEETQSMIAAVGCVITGASEQIAPADRKLYALRDVTGTVPSIPLITASILSKKLAEGLDALVLDVKCGSGAFMKTRTRATELAQSLVNVASQTGVKATALVTDMSRPMGKLIGNSVEIDEGLSILQDAGPADVRELTLCLASEVMQSALGIDLQTARSRLEQSLASGLAMERFEHMVAAQRGDLKALIPRETCRVFTTNCEGFVQTFDCEKMGWAVIELGGGRRKLGDTLNHATGLEVLVDVGEQVEAGQPVYHIFSNQPLSSHLQNLLAESIVIGHEQVPQSNLIIDRIAEPIKT